MNKKTREVLFVSFSVVLRKHLCYLFGRGVVVERLQHMGEPLQRIDTCDFAALYQRIEDGVVNGSAIAFVEQVVLAPITDGRWLRSTELLSIW